MFYSEQVPTEFINISEQVPTENIPRKPKPTSCSAPPTGEEGDDDNCNYEIYDNYDNNNYDEDNHDTDNYNNNNQDND